MGGSEQRNLHNHVVGSFLMIYSMFLIDLYFFINCFLLGNYSFPLLCVTIVSVNEGTGYYRSKKGYIVCSEKAHDLFYCTHSMPYRLLKKHNLVLSDIDKLV